MNVMRWSPAELKDKMDLFGDLVQKGKYTKIPYDTWRTIIRKANNGWWATVNSLYDDCELFLEEPNGNCWAHQFSKKDGSFGEFLENEFGAEDVMNNCLAAKVSDIAATSSAVSGCVSDIVSNKYDGAVTAITGLSDTVSSAYPAYKVNTYYDINSTDGLSSSSVISSDYIIKADEVSAPTMSITVDDDGNIYCNDKKILTADDKNTEKENKTMKNFNFDFGPCDANTIRMSMYGLAIKNAAGTWVSYNPATKQIIDVDVLNFDGAKYMYKMPVALKDVKAGDIVIHNRKPMFVTGTANDQSNALQVVDIYAGEEKCVVPAVSPFGFNFVTKVISLFGNMMAPAQATAETPFGNPFMMYALMSGENNTLTDMLPFMLMNGNNVDMTTNPMMWMLLMDKGVMDKDLLMMMALSGNLNMAPVKNN